jgi:hypothetical protein
MDYLNEETLGERACREIVTGIVRFLAMNDEPVIPDSPEFSMAALNLLSLLETDRDEVFEESGDSFLVCLAGATEAAAAHGGKELREHYYDHLRYLFVALLELHQKGEFAGSRRKARELFARYLGPSA